MQLILTSVFRRLHLHVSIAYTCNLRAGRLEEHVALTVTQRESSSSNVLAEIVSRAENLFQGSRKQPDITSWPSTGKRILEVGSRHLSRAVKSLRESPSSSDHCGSIQNVKQGVQTTVPGSSPCDTVCAWVLLWLCRCMSHDSAYTHVSDRTQSRCNLLLCWSFIDGSGCRAQSLQAWRLPGASFPPCRLPGLQQVGQNRLEFACSKLGVM